MIRRLAGQTRPLSWRLPVIALVTAFMAGSIAVASVAFVSGGSLRGDRVLVRFGRVGLRFEWLNAISERGFRYWYVPRCYALLPDDWTCQTVNPCLRPDGHIRATGKSFSDYLAAQLQRADFSTLPRWLPQPPNPHYPLEGCCTIFITAGGRTVSDQGIYRPYMIPPANRAEARFWRLYVALSRLVRRNHVDTSCASSSS